MSVLVRQAQPPHKCPVRTGQPWQERRLDVGGLVRLVILSDAPGTVRACGDCGKTWVAYRPTYRLPGTSGQVWAPEVVLWRPEGRIERWRRERRVRS